MGLMVSVTSILLMLFGGELLRQRMARRRTP